MGLSRGPFRGDDCLMSSETADKEFRLALSKKGLSPDTGVGSILLEEMATEWLLERVALCNDRCFRSFKYRLEMEGQSEVAA